MQNYIPQGQVVNNQNVPPQQMPPQQACCPAGMPPSCSAVNIQILNPTAGSPNGYYYPQQTASAYDAGTQGGCYNSGYYTTGAYNNPYANGGYYPQNSGYTPATQQPVQQPAQNQSGSATPANSSNSVDKNSTSGNVQENVKNGANQNSTTASAPNDKMNSGTDTINGESSKNESSKQDSAQGASGTVSENDKGGTDTPNAQKTNDEKNGENTVNNSNSTSSENTSKETKDSETVQSNKHKEKRDVVELTDNYIKTLENYLNSQDIEVRKMGAREVVNRLEEDPSRKDDPALTALVNKMLQDPSVAIRAVALSIVESQALHGNDLTASILRKMQTSKEGFGQDAIQASSALLKMAGKTVEKVVDVPNKKSVSKQEDKKSDDKKADKK